MNKAERIYLDTDKEILELIKFHREATRIAEQSAGGGVNEILERWKTDLDEYESLVHRRVTSRIDMETIKTEKEERLLNQRLNIWCNKCGEQRKISIIGEQRNALSDTMHDAVKCTVCHSRFVNIFPNNEVDKVKNYKFWIDQMTTSSMLNERVLPEKEKLANIELFEKVLANHLAEEEDMRQVNEYEKGKEQDLMNIRAMLLETQLSLLALGQSHGYA